MELKIKSLAEYVDVICNLNVDLRKDAAIYEVLLFRGQSDCEYELLPSIARNRMHECSVSILNDERNLIEMAKYKMPSMFHNNMQPIELLALLQHYGIPTRLMDITENPLVALYFACVTNRDKDGEIIIFKDNERDITNYPVVNALAESYKFLRATYSALYLFYGDVINQPYFIEQLQAMGILHETNEEGANWIEGCCKDVLFVHTNQNSIRQKVQRGRYILFPNDIGDDDGVKCFKKIISPLSKNHESVIGRLIVDAAAKEQLLKDLKCFGIDKEMLFCDSVDTVCCSIKETFASKY